MSKKPKQAEETRASSIQGQQEEPQETNPPAGEGSEDTRPTTNPETKAEETVPVTEQQKENGYREPEKFKDPVSANADPRDQPSNFGTPISSTVHTKEQEVGDQTPIKEGEPLPTPPSPAIRYQPGSSDAEKQETQEFKAVTPPGGVVGEQEAKFFPRAVMLVGSKKRIQKGIEEANSGGPSNEDGDKYALGFQLAAMAVKDLDVQDNQRIRLNIEWSDKGAPRVDPKVEDVMLPQGAKSVEQLEEEEQKAK